MSIVIEKSPVVRRPGEFAPMLNEDTRAALRRVHHAAAHLHLEVQALPDGFSPSDEWLMERMEWSRTRLRKAKEGLIAAGLYVYERIRLASGQCITVSRYLTNAVRGNASPQVPPTDPLLAAGQAALIPPPREVKREGRVPHDPDDCRRNLAGQPCRQCAQVARVAAAAAGPAEKPSPATHSPAARPVADVLAAELGDVDAPVPMPADLRAQVAGLFANRRASKVDRARGRPAGRTF